MLSKSPPILKKFAFKAENAKNYSFCMYSRSHPHPPKKERKKKKDRKKHPYLFQQKLLYRNETGTIHHSLMSTSD